MHLPAVARVAAVIVLSTSAAWAQPIPESVYPPPEPIGVEDPRDANTGVHFDLGVTYTTDYIWRGIERFDAGRSEDAGNLQFDARLFYDLGKLPHPYVNLFVNTAEQDPVSNFQEVRPEVGFDWTIRPITLSAGYTSYLFPDRENIETSEIFVKLALDDSLLFRTERPIFHPYVFAAYDIDLYDGLYVEAGLQHALPLEDTPLTFIVNAHAAYVNGFDLFKADPADEESSASGFQHWQVGLTLRYDLNEPLNLPDRFGRIAIEGFINYTGAIDKELLAEDELWGGVAVKLSF